MSGHETPKETPAEVLIVDDIPANLKLLTDILTERGYRVRPAASGYLALRSVAARPPDLILLDVKMPDMDGFEVCRRLKSDEKSRDIPVIFVSALDNTADKVKGFDAGGIDYITKPFQAEEVLARVGTHLTLRRLQEQLEAQNTQLQLEIAERRQAEEALQESQTLYHSLVENLPQYVFRKDLEGRYTFVNQGFCRSLGKTPDNILGKISTELFPPDVAERYHEDDAYVIATGQIRDREEEYPSLGGERRCIQVVKTPVFDAEQRITGVQGIFWDITKRKRAEEALRALTSRHQAILEAIPDIIMEVDANKVYRWANHAGFTFFGEGVLGKAADYYFEGKQDTYGLVQPLFSGYENVIYVESWQRRKDGEKRLLAWWCRVLKDANGNMTGALSTARDITESKRAEEKVREQVDFLETLFDTIPNPIFHKDANGRYTGCNRAFLELTGKTMEEIVGKTVYDIAPKDIADKYAEKDRELFEHPGKQHYECQVEHTPGEVREVIFDKATLLYAHGAVSGLIGVISDITHRKRAEVALQASQQIIEGIINAIPVRVFWKDKNLVYLGCNAVFARDAGFADPKDIIGKDDYQMVWRDQAELYRSDDRQVIESGGSKLFIEEPQTTPDGKTITLLTSKMPLCNTEGAISGVLGTYMDITERKQAEAVKERLEAQSQQLQKAESLGRMAGAIAHHFNNQLGVVMGNLDLAMINLPHGTQTHSDIAEAMKASHRAAEVSGLMLTYLGQTAGKREPLDLSEACRRSLPILRAAMPKDVALETDLPSLGPAISANANQIQQVLTNLVTNAWEAVGDGRGAIPLRIKTVSAADIPTANRFPIDWQPQDHAYACLEVVDVGCGIADHDIEKLFDPFFSSKFTGRGLGLPVVLGIVRAHGGAVMVESEPGRGSVFRVFFPVSAEAVPRQPDKAAKAREIEGGGTVLVVEDEGMLRNMAEAMLTHLGFAVLAAKDGVEAVEVFRQHQDTIRCVLCDLTMPRMNGWETLAALRKLAPDIPVILTSGYDEARVMQGDHPELPQAFLHKPYQMRDLEAAISAAHKAQLAENIGS